MIKKNVTNKDNPPSKKTVPERKVGKDTWQPLITAEKTKNNTDIAIDTFNVFLLII